MATHYSIFTGKTKKIRTGTTAPTSTPVQGEVYLNTTATGIMLSIYKVNTWYYIGTQR